MLQPSLLPRLRELSFCLSDSTRLRILNFLLIQGTSWTTVSSVAAFLETDAKTISHHLQILRTPGIVEQEAEGRFRLYRVDRTKLHELSSLILQLSGS